MRHFLSILTLSLTLISCRPEQVSTDFTAKEGADNGNIGAIVLPFDEGEEGQSSSGNSESEAETAGSESESEAETTGSESESEGETAESESLCEVDIKTTSNLAGSAKNIYVGSENFLTEKASEVLTSSEQAVLQSFINVTNFPASSGIQIEETEDFRLRDDLGSQTLFLGSQSGLTFKSTNALGQRIILFSRDEINLKITKNEIDNIMIFVLAGNEVCIQENGQTNVHIEVMANSAQDVFISGKANSTEESVVTSIIHNAKEANQAWKFTSISDTQINIENRQSINGSVDFKSTSIERSQISVAQVASQSLNLGLKFTSFEAPNQFAQESNYFETSLVGSSAYVDLKGTSLGKDSVISIEKDVSGVTQLESKLIHGTESNGFRNYGGVFNENLEIIGQ